VLRNGGASENLIDSESVPSFSCRPCRNAFLIQSGGNSIKGHARGPEFLHAGNNVLFAFARTIGLPAFTAACSGLHPLASRPEASKRYSP